jgi:chromosome segregation ATPase
MQYLVGQMLACLLGAALIGLAIGWAWWGMRLRQSHERAADLEQKAAKLSGYPARLTDAEATHAAFVASKNEESAKCKARVAELEPLAAKVPELEKSLAAKTGEWEGLRTEIAGKTTEIATLQGKLKDLEAQYLGTVKSKDAVIADHVQTHSEKDVRLATLTGRVAELEPVAKRVPLLESQIAQHVDANKEKDEHLQLLVGEVDALKPVAAKVPELMAQTKLLEAAHAEKDARIAELLPVAALATSLTTELEQKDAHVAELTSQVEKHLAAHAEKDAQIAELAPLAALVPELKMQVGAHEAAHAEKDARIAELAPLAALVPELKMQVGAHEAAHAEKDARIGELAPLASLVPELKAHVEAKDAHIADLTSQVELHAAALSEKDAHIADLTAQVERPAVAAHAEKEEHTAELIAAAALVPALKAEVEGHVAAHADKDAQIAELKTNLDEKDTQVSALLSRVQELQPLVGNTIELQTRAETAEYESNLATRKLRMAESAVAAHEGEIAKLHDQLMMRKSELETAQQDRSQEVPLKAMAAAAGGSGTYGFYDVNEGSVASATKEAAPAPDYVREFEKRIEELQSLESAKDREITKLRSQLAEIEAAPDTDTRRQILIAAKNAELTHVRGVLNSLFQPVSQDEVALRAFSYAKERGFGGGSAMEDWLRAERDTHFGRLAYAWESTHSGTMY